MAIKSLKNYEFQPFFYKHFGCKLWGFFETWTLKLWNVEPNDLLKKFWFEKFILIDFMLHKNSVNLILK